MNKIYKAGLQSKGDPFTFVMSTADPDRAGDIVEQDWDLKDFADNPIALWGHDTETPIGNWENVRVENNRLVGDLSLAEEGTSSEIDTIRSLVRQRIVKAVSVGFIPGDMTPLKKSKGYRLSKNQLFECSLCSVPMNPKALALCKNLDSDAMKRLFGESADDPMFLSVAEQLKSRDSDISPPKLERKATMRLSDRIEEKQTQLTTLRNQLADLTDTVDDNGEFTDETQVAIDECADSIDAAEKALKTLLAAEKRLQVQGSELAVPAAPERKKASAPSQPRIQVMPKEREKGALAISALACAIRGYATKSNAMDVAKSYRKDDDELNYILRAATDPATTTDPEWAAPLVRETWGQYIDLLRDLSVYPRLPGTRLDFDRNGRIKLPKNTGRGKLAGGFVGELAPIPVKEGSYGTVDLDPKKMAVISSFSDEIGRHSVPAIEGLIRDQILNDTAEVLDVLYTDDQPRSVLRPAGLQDPTETGAANINAATGTTVANIISDTKGMLTRALQSRSGNTGVWIMNPIHVLGLEDTQDAASGEFPFKAELANGTFRRSPVISSQNIPEGLLIYQTSGSMSYGNDYAPQILVDNTATLVFDDTAPEDIIGGGTPTTQPVKSMYQVMGVAVRMAMGLDWRIVRQGGIQVLTGWAV